MKKILLFFALLVIETHVFSQNFIKYISVESFKGWFSTYAYGDEKIVYSVWNTNNTLWNIVPKYKSCDEIISIEVENKSRLDVLVRAFF